VANRSEEEARQILTDAGFTAGQIVNQSAERDDVPAGTVVGTEPGTGTAVGVGEEIILLIAVPTPTEPTPTPTPTTSAPVPPPPGGADEDGN
jgi:serine/threonine-protein kinase